MFRILVINPGSTSTKMALFEDEQERCTYCEKHTAEKLKQFSSIVDQKEFRTQVVKDWMEENQINHQSLDAVVGRGGLLKPVEGGCYEVNDAMIEDLRIGVQGQHASNLGGLIANDIADSAGIVAYIVDPVVVDEMAPVARYSGHPVFERKSIFHALNQRAVAMEAAKSLNLSYQNCRLIVVHLGGGISIGAHANGQVIDVNNALNGEGPFAPERSGGLPSGQLVDFCFESGQSQKDILKMLAGKGGLVAYLGTNDSLEINQRIQDGDRYAAEVIDAMAYQISKTIGSMAVVLDGEVDAIVFTGGLARDKDLVQNIRSKVDWISQILVMPGEREMDALALGVLRVLKGEENAREYL